MVICDSNATSVHTIKTDLDYVCSYIQWNCSKFICTAQCMLLFSHVPDYSQTNKEICVRLVMKMIDSVAKAT